MTQIQWSPSCQQTISLFHCGGLHQDAKRTDEICSTHCFSHVVWGPHSSVMSEMYKTCLGFLKQQLKSLTKNSFSPPSTLDSSEQVHRTLRCQMGHNSSHSCDCQIIHAKCQHVPHWFSLRNSEESKYVGPTSLHSTVVDTGLSVYTEGDYSFLHDNVYAQTTHKYTNDRNCHRITSLAFWESSVNISKYQM